MGNTPNNNFPFPESTDLVKDGAQAIEDLADAIDTTLGVYSPVTPMGVHLSTVSFNGVASFSINDVFSATYNNYKLIINITNSSGNQFLLWRARVGGVDNSSSNYQWNQLLYNSSTTPGTSFVGSNTLDTSARFGEGRVRSSNELELYGIFESIKTQSISNAVTVDVGDGISQVRYAAGMSVTTSYTGITILSSSTSITGVCHVYGYNK
jgi:hypothetical protein